MNHHHFFAAEHSVCQTTGVAQRQWNSQRRRPAPPSPALLLPPKKAGGEGSQIRHWFAHCLAVFAILWGSSQLHAGAIDLVHPGGFAPGVPFTVAVIMPAATNLGAYNIDILLTGSSGQAGTDFYFDLAATNAAATGYVFPATDFFATASNLDSASTERLTLTDFDFVGVNVISGINSAIADVVVNTVPGYSGVLTLMVDGNALILDTPDLTPTPVAEFNSILADTIAADPLTLTNVPEPNAVAVVSIALAAAFQRRTRARISKCL